MGGSTETSQETIDSKNIPIVDEIKKEEIKKEVQKMTINKYINKIKDYFNNEGTLKFFLYILPIALFYSALFENLLSISFYGNFFLYTSIFICLLGNINPKSIDLNNALITLCLIGFKIMFGITVLGDNINIIVYLIIFATMCYRYGMNIVPYKVSLLSFGIIIRVLCIMTCHSFINPDSINERNECKINAFYMVMNISMNIFLADNTTYEKYPTKESLPKTIKTLYGIGILFVLLEVFNDFFLIDFTKIWFVCYFISILMNKHFTKMEIPINFMSFLTFYKKKCQECV